MKSQRRSREGTVKETPSPPSGRSGPLAPDEDRAVAVERVEDNLETVEEPCELAGLHTVGFGDPLVGMNWVSTSFVASHAGAGVRPALALATPASITGICLLAGD